MMASSAAALKDVDVVLRRRLVHLGAVQGLPITDTVNADPDTILKTRMIRDRLKMLQGDDVSRILGRAPASVHPDSPWGQPIQAQPVRPGPSVAVAEPPTPTRVSTPAPVPASAPAPTYAAAEPEPTLVGVANRGYHRGTLVVRSGPSAGMRYEINAPRIIIGRRSADSNSNADVPVMMIDDARISRHHLEIFAKPDGLYVRDLGSANGSLLNGRQLGGEPVRLEDGAEIYVGPDSVLNYRAN